MPDEDFLRALLIILCIKQSASGKFDLALVINTFVYNLSTIAFYSNCLITNVITN